MDIQEAIKGIATMTQYLDPEEDYLTIAAAEEQMSARASARQKELEEARNNLKALSRLLEAARASSTRPPSVPSAEKHLETINALDATGLQLVKAINDYQSDLASKEGELARLKEEARMLEESDPAAEAQAELDGTALRLQIYKGLGFEPILDRNGNLEKMLVESSSGDIHVVNLREGRSDFENADRMWKLASS